MTNKEIRRQALDVLRKEPLRVISLTLMLALPALAAWLWTMLIYGLMIHNDLFVVYTSFQGEIQLAPVNGATVGMFIPYICGMVGGQMFIGIMSMGLIPGYFHCLLELVRGGKPSLKALFSRVDTCLKVLGLQLLIALKAVLWLLPFLLSALLLVTASMNTDAATVFSALSVLIVLAGYVFVLRMALRHAFTLWYVADQPEIRIRESIHLSKQSLRGKLWRLIRLNIPYWLWVDGLLFAAGLLMVALPVLETPFSSFILFVLFVFPAAMLTALTCAGFYAVHGVQEQGGDSAGEKEPQQESK